MRQQREAAELAQRVASLNSALDKATSQRNELQSRLAQANACKGLQKDRAANSG